MLVSAADLTNQYTPGLLKSNQRVGWQNQRAVLGGSSRKQRLIAIGYPAEITLSLGL